MSRDRATSETSMLSLHKVKLRMETEFTCFDGGEALREVAKPDGHWNWALVGHDVENLPLVGGGKHGVEEMANAVHSQPHAFGLLRMHFGVGDKAKLKWLFVHTQEPIDSGNFTLREHGQARMQEPKMDKAISEICNFSTKVVLHGKDEYSNENLVAALTQAKGRLDADVTMENFLAALEAKRQTEEEEDGQAIKEGKQPERLQLIEEEFFVDTMTETAPRSKLRTQESVMDLGEEPSDTKQRKQVTLYNQGDQVEVYSQKHDTWMLDAEIVDVVRESCVIDGYQVRAGSMKVEYANGARYKWVAPQQIEDELRLSPRPRPPNPMVGALSKLAMGWWITLWHERYFELNKGFLQWWVSEADAKHGVKPNGSVYLLGLKQQNEEKVFKVTTISTKGVVYSFGAETDEQAVEWVDGLWAHASYCEDLREYLESRKAEVQQEVSTKSE